jgi:hypothetical protein
MVCHDYEQAYRERRGFTGASDGVMERCTENGQSSASVGNFRNAAQTRDAQTQACEYRRERDRTIWFAWCGRLQRSASSNALRRRRQLGPLTDKPSLGTAHTLRRAQADEPPPPLPSTPYLKPPPVHKTGVHVERVTAAHVCETVTRRVICCGRYGQSGFFNGRSRLAVHARLQS